MNKTGTQKQTYSFLRLVSRCNMINLNVNDL